MIKNIGITGQHGFIGDSLFRAFNTKTEKFNVVHFEKEWFGNSSKMDNFVKQCDAILHLAALNRHHDLQFIYDTNLELTNKLIDSLERTQSKAHILFSSSTQESNDSLYGKSKFKARGLLYEWSIRSGGIFTGLIIPNVFGPFGRPYYNSVVATFCHQVAVNELPLVNNDAELKLIYIGDLVDKIIECVENSTQEPSLRIEHKIEIGVSGLLNKILIFKEIYQNSGQIPTFESTFDLQLFNTYRSYIELKNYFPRKLNLHSDNRGTFVELIKAETEGQFSFSTTHPGITRGNHYHTRKIERFIVIKGEALIQLRRVGSDEIIEFYVNGDEPAYVDMPVWYTHNIKNVGNQILYTNFWINELYDPNDPDTYFETV